MKAGAIDVLPARRGRAEVAAIGQRFNTLSPRERDVFRIVIQGRLNKQIADELGISEKTVKFHRGNVMKKMQAGSLPNWFARLTASDGERPTKDRPNQRPSGSA